MTAQPPRRVRRRWVRVAGGAVVLALLVFGVGSLLSGGPSPRLATVEKEPILVAPVHAVELGRSTQESHWGPGLPDSHADVIVAYQVDLTPEQALAAWVGAYGERYGLTDAFSVRGVMVKGRAGGMAVNVYISDKVEAPGDVMSEFATPSPGSTVVTVVVSGG